MNRCDRTNRTSLALTTLVALLATAACASPGNGSTLVRAMTVEHVVARGDGWVVLAELLGETTWDVAAWSASAAGKPRIAWPSGMSDALPAQRAHLDERRLDLPPPSLR